MKEPKFYTKTGKLTRYSLACGYVEKTEINGQSLTLWMEYNTLHVRQHCHNHNKRIFWESFDSLTDARKFYNDKKKNLSLDKCNVIG